MKLEVSEQLDSEINACLKLWRDQGSFHAFIHSDPCPDNCLVSGQGFKLLDFEFGQFGFALWDGAYARSHFPTCWCVNRIPPQIVERVEIVYREQLIQGCPPAADDKQFGAAVVASCLCAVFMTLRGELPKLLEQDDEWGIATQRQRVLVRLKALSEATQRWNHSPALGTAAQQLAAALGQLWLNEMDEMPLYPAFSEVA